MSADSIDADFRYYRQECDALPQSSIETEGIFDPAVFAAILADPDTLSITIDGLHIPLLTRLSLLPDRSEQPYQRMVGDGHTMVEVWYYNHLPWVLDAHEVKAQALFADFLPSLAERHAVIAYDAPEARLASTEEDIGRIVQAIGGVAMGNSMTVSTHYDYVSSMVPGERYDTAQQRPLLLPALYTEATAEGAITADSAIEVIGTVAEADRDHLIRMYKAAHQALAGDVSNAEFTDDELQAVLVDPAFTKVMYRTEAGVIHFTLYADVRNCPWLNQAYFEQYYPNQYATGRILCGVGAASEATAPHGLSKQTAGLVAQLIGYASGTHTTEDTVVIVAYAADDTSEPYVTRIVGPAVDNADIRAHFDAPVSKQIFRAVQLYPATPE